MSWTGTGLAAQERGGHGGTDPAYAGPQQVISLNPFGIVATWYNLEYERRINHLFTWGVAGSYVELDGDDDHYVSGNALVRYYPQGQALQGFFFGGRTGLYHVGDSQEQGALFGVGFELGYTWLLGDTDNFQISLGAGASRLWGGVVDGSQGIPVVRLVNVGLAF